MKLQLLNASSGAVLYDGLVVDALTTLLQYPGPNGAPVVVRVTRSLAPVASPAGATVRVYCEPTDPPPPPP